MSLKYFFNDTDGSMGSLIRSLLSLRSARVILPYLSMRWSRRSLVVTPTKAVYLPFNYKMYVSSTALMIWFLNASSIFVAFSKMRCSSCFYYFSFSPRDPVSLLGMTSAASVPGWSHAITTVVVYSLSFTIIPMCPWALSPSIVGSDVAFP